MPKLTIMVGYPGSGKSTYVEKHYDHAYIVSQDVAGSKGKFFETIRQLMEEGFDIVADRCNQTKKHRQALIDLAKTYNYSVEMIWIATPHVVALRQLRDREEHLTIDPKSSILHKETIYWRFADEFETPSMNEDVESLEIVGLVNKCMQCGNYAISDDNECAECFNKKNSSF